MKTKTQTPLANSIVVLATLCIVWGRAAGQHNEPIISETIAVTARPSADSITLRWAPMNHNIWQWGNHYGYRIERYVLSRGGRLVARPEKTILHPALKPLPESGWENLVPRERYAAIAAQALFGEQFEVDIKQSDIVTLVNKARENEQRYAFALFSADMSPKVARASGLWFTDTAVTKTEKYLYRVVVNSMDSLRGSIFISPDDRYELPTPRNLQADFKNQLVSLRWDITVVRYYTAYIVERSEDGNKFESISDAPLVTVSPTETGDVRYEYAMDSLKDLSKTYHYRVKGITPFGEMSPPSPVIIGRGSPPVSQVPYISGTQNTDNRSLLILWDFPESANHAIRGFAIERSSTPKGNFASITDKLLPGTTRIYKDRSPQLTNYYRVTAHGLDGVSYSSHVYFAQLVDSVPPSSPTGLEAKVSSEGTVTLTWKPNTEHDIYGYRIYKAYHQSEELAQITETPVAQHFFTDRVDLNILNESVYYRVMALDLHQNHSPLSDYVKASLPDKVRPQPAVFLPVNSNSKGISLSWNKGASEDIVQYKLYRKAGAQSQWQLIKTADAMSDSVFHYVDEDALSGTNYYTVISIDDAGLESDPATPVAGNRPDNQPGPPIRWKKPRINREENQITLAWDYTLASIESFKIYKAVDNEPPTLFQTVVATQKEFTDTMIPGQHYRYRIMALFVDGKKSFLSDEIEFQY